MKRWIVTSVLFTKTMVPEGLGSFVTPGSWPKVIRDLDSSAVAVVLDGRVGHKGGRIIRATRSRHNISWGLRLRNSTGFAMR